jgi:hypothetical protein
MDRAVHTETRTRHRVQPKVHATYCGMAIRGPLTTLVTTWEHDCGSCELAYQAEQQRIAAGAS